MKAPHIDIGSFWLPKASSTLAAQVDSAFGWVYWNAVVFFVIIVTTLVVFVAKYKRRTENDVTSSVSHNMRLEIVWTVIPTVIVIALFFAGLAGFVNGQIAPSNAYEIQVTAQKWSWTFTYPNGSVSPGVLVVPKDRPVKLILSSRDILHSFFVPEFRIKQDAVPSMYTSLWFEATEAKETAILCTEYCGTGHSAMLGTVKVVEQPAFQEWLDNGGDDGKTPPAEAGKKIYSAQCSACHSVDGSRVVGPSFKGLFGRAEHVVGAGEVKVDENYIRESINVPGAKVVEGFANIMPPFKGVLNDKQIDQLVAYIKTLQ